MVCHISLSKTLRLVLINQLKLVNVLENKFYQIALKYIDTPKTQYRMK